MTNEIPDFRGTHLWDRLNWAHTNLKSQQSKYRIVYEDPLTPDEPAKVVVPAGEWLACALAGGILPPIDAYLGMPLEIDMEDGTTIQCSYTEAQDIRQTTKIKGERVLPHHTLHTSTPIGPMTEEEAIEYLLLKDVPKRVWGDSRKHNRLMFAICTIDQLPAHRKYRNAWTLKQFQLMEKAA